MGGQRSGNDGMSVKIWGWWFAGKCVGVNRWNGVQCPMPRIEN